MILSPAYREITLFYTGGTSTGFNNPSNIFDQNSSTYGDAAIPYPTASVVSCTTFDPSSLGSKTIVKCELIIKSMISEAGLEITVNWPLNSGSVYIKQLDFTPSTHLSIETITRDVTFIGENPTPLTLASLTNLNIGISIANMSSSSNKTVRIYSVQFKITHISPSYSIKSTTLTYNAGTEETGNGTIGPWVNRSNAFNGAEGTYASIGSTAVGSSWWLVGTGHPLPIYSHKIIGVVGWTRVYTSPAYRNFGIYARMDLGYSYIEYAYYMTQNTNVAWWPVYIPSNISGETPYTWDRINKMNLITQHISLGTSARTTYCDAMKLVVYYIHLPMMVFGEKSSSL